MIIKITNKKYFLPVVVVLGVVLDLFLSENSLSYVYVIVLIVLLVVIKRDQTKPVVLYSIALFLFILLSLCALIFLDSAVTEKLAAWFLIFALLAVLKRILILHKAG